MAELVGLYVRLAVVVGFEGVAPAGMARVAVVREARTRRDGRARNECMIEDFG